MKNYLIYDREGKIIQTGVVPAAMFDLQGDAESGRYVMEGSADVCTDRVVDGAVVSRPSCPAQVSTSTVKADGMDEVILWQVPVGARVSVEGPLATAGAADGSNIRLTFARSGDYLIRIELFPFLTLEVPIHAS